MREFLGLGWHKNPFYQQLVCDLGKIKHVKLNLCCKQAFSVALQSCPSVRSDGYMLVE